MAFSVHIMYNMAHPFGSWHKFKIKKMMINFSVLSTFKKIFFFPLVQITIYKRNFTTLGAKERLKNDLGEETESSNAYN